MRLELDENDLRPEFKDTPTSLINFRYFNENAKRALSLVGGGTFYRGKGGPQENYNRVYIYPLDEPSRRRQRRS